MSLAPRAAARKGGPRVLLDGGDPAIPIDRVPYFTGDLKRLLVAVAAMIVLLLAGAQLIPLVVR
jgi:hypothetical protein